MKKVYLIILVLCFSNIVYSGLDEKRIYRFINKKGKIVIKIRFITKIIFGGYDFSNGLALVKIKNKYGFIDKTGKIIIKPQFDNVSNFHDTLSFVNDKIWKRIESGSLIPKKYNLNSKYNNIIDCVTVTNLLMRKYKHTYYNTILTMSVIDLIRILTNN